MYIYTTMFHSNGNGNGNGNGGGEGGGYFLDGAVFLFTRLLFHVSITLHSPFFVK